MSLSTDASRTIRDMDRNQIEKILASYGYQVYDHETTEDLRQNLKDDVANGVIAEDDLYTPTAQLTDCRDR